MEYDCDILVIGSGVSGICAAIQAGRRGCRTILIEKDEMLGGNSGPNLGVEVRGAQHFNDYGQEVGVIHELENEEAYTCASTPVHGMLYNISRRREALFQEYLESAGVTVLKSHYARKPVMEKNRIAAVEVEDTGSFRSLTIRPKIVIEASGDGQTARLAGADFAVDPEPRSAFGERSAVEHPAKMIQGTSLTAIAIKTGRETPFVPPAGTPPYSPRTWEDRLSFHYNELTGRNRQFSADAPEGRISFLYFTEAGGDLDTVADANEIYGQLLQQVWSFWNHVKNGPSAEEAKMWDLLWVSPKAGKRQSRRFLGDCILTQNDVESGATFPDDIAYGGHNLDEHRSAGEICSIYSHSVPPMYGIPYRCCYSRNIDNLLLGGRLISATHLAHASSRVMRTGGAIGQAIGLAAALCVEHGCPPREIYEKRLGEFRRELLRADGSPPPVQFRDPDDLAPSAEVTADAERRFNDLAPGVAVPLFAPAGAMLYDWPEVIERLELFLENPTQEAVAGRLVVSRYAPGRRWLLRQEFDEFRRDTPGSANFKQLAETAVTVPAGFSGCLPVELPGGVRPGAKNRFDAGDRLLIALHMPDARIRWRMAETPVELCRTVEYDAHRDGWIPFDATPALRIYPELPFGEAVNVVNGFNRRFGPAPCDLWLAPFTGEALRLTFRWKTPQRIRRAVIYFDDLEPTPDRNPWRSHRRVSEKLLKDYALEAEIDGKYLELVRVTENRKRRCEHLFPAVACTAFRVRVDAVRGGEARIYQVNLFA